MQFVPSFIAVRQDISRSRAGWTLFFPFFPVRSKNSFHPEYLSLLSKA